MRRITAAIAAMAIGAAALSAPAMSQQQRPGATRASPPQVGQGQRGFDGHGMHPGGRPMGPPPSPERMFAEMDANKDGSVSRAEFTAFHEKHRCVGPPSGGGMGPPPDGDGQRQGPPRRR